MKKKFLYLSLVTLASLLIACEENEIMPSFETKQTSLTRTMATIEVSDEEPGPVDDVTVVLSYVNSSVEPLKTITLKAKVGEGAFTDIDTWDVSQDQKDIVLTKTLTYQTPAAGGVDVFLDMVVASHKELPQVERVVLEVQE